MNTEGVEVNIKIGKTYCKWLNQARAYENKRKHDCVCEEKAGII